MRITKYREHERLRRLFSYAETKFRKLDTDTIRGIRRRNYWLDVRAACLREMSKEWAT